jgi:hypothetical protein
MTTAQYKAMKKEQARRNNVFLAALHLTFHESLKMRNKKREYCPDCGLNSRGEIDGEVPKLGLSE